MVKRYSVVSVGLSWIGNGDPFNAGAFDEVEEFDDITVGNPLGTTKVNEVWCFAFVLKLEELFFELTGLDLIAVGGPHGAVLLKEDGHAIVVLNDRLWACHIRLWAKRDDPKEGADEHSHAKDEHELK